MSRTMIMLAFCASGLCALALEVLWTRMLALVFGGTALAITTVLTAYMAGLAGGSWWGGRLASRLQRPVRTYALLEAGIGVWALLVPWLLLPLPSLLEFAALDQSPILLALFRFLLAFLILLPPTWMMGATLPILSTTFREETHASQDVGLLYAANTLGAVLGCLLTGFVLLPQLGNRGSMLAIAATNFLLALLVGSLARRAPTQPPQAAPQTGPQATTPPSQTRLVRQVKLLFGIAGAMAMACQVSWGRVLAMVIGSSLYAFVLVLASFLIGLAGGAWVAARLIKRTQRPLRVTTLLLLATGLSILGGMAFIDRLPLVFATLVQTLAAALAHQSWLLFGIKALLIMTVVLLPTLLMGALFPLVLRICFGKREQLGAVVGEIYAWNTVGAIVGSFAAGFVLVPWWGTQGTLRGAVIGYCLCAAFAWRLHNGKTNETLHTQRLGGYLAAAATLLLVLIWPGAWDQHRLSLGMFRISQLQRFQRTKGPTPYVHSFEEGRSATVTVEKLGKQVALKINGKTDASTGIDMPTQLLAGLLPLVLHGTAKDVLVIGWGSGVTVGAALQFPVKRVTAIELEPAVVRGARAFAAWNHDPQKDPRLTLRYEDGRHHLATHRGRYDVIISEPSNPWISGVSALFTVEFFRLAKARLAPGGVFCQWVQLYELSTTNIRSLLGSARSVFPQAYLWSPSRGGRDSLLIATHGGHKGWKLADVAKRLQSLPNVQREFRRAGMQGAADLLVRLMLGPAALKRLTKGAIFNTDDNGQVALTAPIELLTQRAVNGKAWLQKQAGLSLQRAAGLLGVVMKPPQRAAVFLALLRYGSIKAAKEELLRLEAQAPRAPETRYSRTLWQGLFVPERALEGCLRKRRNKKEWLRVVRCWEHLGLPKVSGHRLLAWLKLPKGSPRRQMLLGFLGYAHKRSLSGLQAIAPLTRQRDWLRRYPGICYLLSQLYRTQKIWPEAVWFQRLFQKNRRQTANRHRLERRIP